MRSLRSWAAAIAAGAAIGIAAAWAAIEFGRSASTARYGDWTHDAAAGSEGAGAYARAIVARKGLLALSAADAVYFTLERDREGRPLDEGCIYLIGGGEPDARWWSLTLYRPDGFLAPGGDHAASVNASYARREGGGWTAQISPVRGNAANWISSRGAGRGFSLMLRIYNPGPEFRPSAEALPVLETVNCGRGA